MNEFLEQFLIECREIVEQATDDLLALEENPKDGERLDGAFRGFHTLKGAAGIVEFAAMERALHAAEDVLSGARSGASPVTPALISDALTCLDQVVQWLDVIARSGDLPPPDRAAAEADTVLRRFGRPEPVVARVASELGWAEALVGRYDAVAARSALRYAPGADSFFRGVDPLRLMEGVPGLLALKMESATPWPALEALDPYACNLVFLALSAATAEEVADATRAAAEEVEIRPVASAYPGAGLSATASAILQAQVRMLQEPVREAVAGRVASAATVAANVLRHAGRDEEAEQVLAASRRSADPGDLALAIARAARGEAVAADPDEADPGARDTPEPAARALRVDVERIDALVNLTGELTVAKNALAHAATLAQADHDPKALAELLGAQQQQFERLVSELQQTVLGLRVLPMRHVFQRFPRLIREMVLSLGKPARLVTEGEATEADKAIVEALFEPLLHVLRNALDHGVEPAEQRAAAGKPPSATIALRALREGEHVIVEVEDDGGGIDPARVRATAAKRGLATEAALDAMGEAEVLDLVFAPGFSTATAVTAFSGRGVGMDAVRSAVARVGGEVSVRSRLGAGTTVRFTLPFTVLMSRVMTVEAGGQMFGIPLEAVVETVRVPRAQIRPVGAASAFVLRDRTLPLIDLGETLGEPRKQAPPADANVVVVSAGGHPGGLEVDRLGQRMDVMLKPLDGLLSGTPGIAGATLLGDGRVLLVLDIQELLQ